MGPSVKPELEPKVDKVHRVDKVDKLGMPRKLANSGKTPRWGSGHKVDKSGERGHKAIEPRNTMPVGSVVQSVKPELEPKVDKVHKSEI